MRVKAGFIGIILLVAGWNAMAYTSDYSGVALPGEHNGWSRIPTFSLIGDGVWRDTVTLNANNLLKIVTVKNGTTTWWGHVGAIILRSDICVSVPDRNRTDDNITLTGLTPGEYRATFREATGELTLEALFPLTPPDIQSLHFIGDFTGNTSNENFRFTQNTADPTLWELSAAIRESINFQFLVDGTNKWGSPVGTTLANPTNVTGYASGGHIFTFTPNPGQYHITFNASNSLFSISRTNDLPPSSAVAVLGSFAPAATSAIGNMRNIRASIWEGTFDITNNGSITGICFTSGDQVWGGTQTLQLPASGTLTPGDGNTLTLTGATPGRYTVTFDIQSATFTFAQAYTTNSGVNLLPNPSFELTNGSEDNPTSWSPFPAGQSIRQTLYPSHSGVASGILKAKILNEWSSNPSFSYDVKNISANSIYTLSAWFRTLYGWNPATPAYIRIEWLDSSGKNLDSPAVSSIANIAEDAWSFVSVEETAPDGAAKAHVVIMASDVGESGYLLVDDVELRESPTRLLNFNGVSPSGDETNRVINGWETYGRIVYNIPPAAPTGGVFISQYVEGTGNNIAVEIFNGTASSIPLSSYYLLQYNNGSNTPSVTIPLGGSADSLTAGDCLVVSRPPIATNAYPPDNAITTPPAGISLQTDALTFNGDDVLVLLCSNNVTITNLDRIGTPGMNFDSIASRATRDHTLVRKNSSTKGTNSFTSDQWNMLPINTFSGLGEHSLTDPDAPYSPPGSAILLSNSTGFIQGGAFSRGIGDISFWYRAEPNADQTLFLSVSTDGNNWTNIASVNASAASNYTYFVASVDSTQFKYVRITNSGTGAVRLDDISVSPQSDILRTQPFESWTNPAFNSVGNYSLREWDLDIGRIVADQGVTASRAACLHTEGILTTPAFSDGIGEVAFWARAINSDPEDTETSPSLDITLAISTNNGTSWTNIAFFNAIGNATNLSAWLYYTNNPTKARISFNSENDAHLLLDNVEARLPAIYRDQNFDSWPYKPEYKIGTSSHQGWTINNCIVQASSDASGLTARLADDTNASAWIQSPRLPDGIGSISFVARKTADTPPTLKIQASPNGATWTDLATVKIDTKTFIPFYYYCANTDHHYVRILHASGAAFTQIDDIRIASPLPRPSVTVTFGLDPAAPTAGNTASVIADIFPSSGVTVLSVTSSVKIGAGNFIPVNWTDSPMTETSHPNAWRSSDTTAPLVKGRTIQSKVTVTYAGIGAASNSTGYSTNTFTTHIQTNRVSSVEKGQVWINEFSYCKTADDGGDMGRKQNHEFIELCGPAGTSIANWTVQLAFGFQSDIDANTNQPIYASYKIPVGTSFTNETNGFGFYVLGDVPSWPTDKVDQRFNTLVPPIGDNNSSNHLHDSGGIIRLLDEYSNLVYEVSYEAFFWNISYTEQQVSISSSVSLGGTGSVYTAFGWKNAGGFSPHTANDGQILVPPSGSGTADVFHIPTKYVEPVGTDAPFYMRNPINAQSKDNLWFHFGFPDDKDYHHGTLYHRLRNNNTPTATWNELPITHLGAADADSNAYARAELPARFYSRGSTIEYFIRADPINGSANTYIAASNNSFKVTTNKVEAEASPFTFTFQVHPEVFIDKFYVTNGSDWVFLTGGNETTGIEGGDPFTDFRIRYTANLLDDTNSWGEITNVSISEVDLYGSNIFTGYNGPTSTPLFFRIDPVW